MEKVPVLNLKAESSFMMGECRKEIKDWGGAGFYYLETTLSFPSAQKWVPKSFEQAIRCYEQAGLGGPNSGIEKQYADWQRNYLELKKNPNNFSNILFLCGFLKAQGNQDYFAVHAGELPVKVFYGLKAQPMSLIGLDPAKGIIFAKQGTAKVQLELRGLKRQNIKGFTYDWPAAQRQAMNNLANEQYDPQYLECSKTCNLQAS